MKKISLLCSLGLAIAGTGPAATSYHLLKKISVGGRGGWDYLTIDDTASRVYLSHATQVEVLHPDSGTVIHHHNAIYQAASSGRPVVIEY